MNILKLAEKAGFGMEYRRNEAGEMVLVRCVEVDIDKLSKFLDLAELDMHNRESDWKKRMENAQ
jgi:hypothetical protein